MDGKLYANYNDFEAFDEKYLINPKQQFVWNNMQFLLSLLGTAGMFCEKGYNIGLFVNKYGKAEEYFPEFVMTNNWHDNERECIYLVQDHYVSAKYLYPIIKIVKQNPKKAIDTQYALQTRNYPDMKDMYYECYKHLNNKFYFKKIYFTIQHILSKLPRYQIVGQILNSNYQLKFIVISFNNREYPFPVISYQGLVYNLPIYEYTVKTDLCTKKLPLVELNDLTTFYQTLDKDTNYQLGLKINKNLIHKDKIIAVRLQNEATIYCKPSNITTSQPSEIIHFDAEIFNSALGKKNDMITDDIIKFDLKQNFDRKHFLHYQLHLSSFLSKSIKHREKISILLDKIDNNESKVERNDMIQDLVKIFEKMRSVLNMANRKIDLKSLKKRSNFVSQCGVVDGDCVDNPHCHSSKNGSCKLIMSERYYAAFSEKIIFEMIFNKLKRKEIFNLDGSFLSKKIGDDLSFTLNKREILDSNINNTNPYQRSDFDLIHSSNDLVFNAQNKTENKVTYNNKFNIISIQNQDSLYIFRALVNSIFKDSLKESSYDIETYYSYKLLSIVGKQLLKNPSLRSVVRKFTTFKTCEEYLYHIYQNNGSYIPELVALSSDLSLVNTPITLYNKQFDIVMRIMNGKIIKNITSLPEGGEGVEIRYRSEQDDQQIYESCLEIQTLFPKKDVK